MTGQRRLFGHFLVSEIEENILNRESLIGRENLIFLVKSAVTVWIPIRAVIFFISLGLYMIGKIYHYGIMIHDISS